jgi:hypothetical protein
LNHDESEQNKILQKKKKYLLQEIDLEDGKIFWLNNYVIDKSRALSICDQLNDLTSRDFHLYIYKNKLVNNFLTKGNTELFHLNTNTDQVDFYELIIDDIEFLNWISPIFSKQFSYVLNKSIKSVDVTNVKCLFSGRRWVSSQHIDICFEEARQNINNLIEPLRVAEKNSNDIKPTFLAINSLVKKTGFLEIINSLPSDLIDLRDEAPALLRSIAINCFNKYDDSDLSQSILRLIDLFNSKSIMLSEQISSDKDKISEIVSEERKDEFTLNFGDTQCSITKEGITYGKLFISANNVEGLRWGKLIGNNNGITYYDFLLFFIDSNKNIKISI